MAADANIVSVLSQALGGRRGSFINTDVSLPLNCWPFSFVFCSIFLVSSEVGGEGGGVNVAWCEILVQWMFSFFCWLTEEVENVAGSRL